MNKNLFPQWMESEKIDEITNQLVSSTKLNNLIELWNARCDDMGTSIIYRNDEDFFSTYYSNNIMELVRAISYGDYKFDNEYVIIDNYSNLTTYTEDEVIYLIDTNILADWIINNSKNDIVKQNIDIELLMFKFKDCLRDTDEFFLTGENEDWVWQWLDENEDKLIGEDWDKLFEEIKNDYETC